MATVLSDTRNERKVTLELTQKELATLMMSLGEVDDENMDEVAMDIDIEILDLRAREEMLAILTQIYGSVESGKQLPIGEEYDFGGNE